MPEPKTKKPAVARRATKAKAKPVEAANTPIPCDRCGSSACDGSCGVPRSVSYRGPTSHPSHHHIKMAAEGQKHTWAAAIIAGLAVVITVSVAYNAVQAASETRTTVRQTVGEVQIIKQITDVKAQLKRMEGKIDALSAANGVVSTLPSTQQGGNGDRFVPPQQHATSGQDAPQTPPPAPPTGDQQAQ